MIATLPGIKMEGDTLLSIRSAQKRLANGATRVGGLVVVMVTILMDHPKLMKMALLIGR